MIKGCFKALKLNKSNFFIISSGVCIYLFFNKAYYQKINEKLKRKKYTYYVPATLFVLP